jgi:hypothetical protein
LMLSCKICSENGEFGEFGEIKGISPSASQK